MSTISFIKQKPNEFPDAFFLAMDGEAIDGSSGSYFLFVITRLLDECVIYKDSPNFDIITEEEFYWILQHPEETYMEMML